MAVPVVITPTVTIYVPGSRRRVFDRINGHLTSDTARATDAVTRMAATSSARMLARFSAARVNARILFVLRECLE